MTLVKKLVLKICNKNGKYWVKEIDLKNYMCYYFDDITKIKDFNFDNTLIDEKSY